MIEPRLYIELQRLALHKATDAHIPFTRNWERSYKDILDREIRAHMPPEPKKCECKCRKCGGHK